MTGCSEPVETRIDEMLDLFVSGRPKNSRADIRRDLVERSEAGLIDLGCSRVVVQNGQLVGCVLVEEQRDHSWQFQMPVVAAEIDAREAQRLTTALLTELSQDFDQSNAWISQLLLPLHNEAEASILANCGFGHLTDLLFLARSTHRIVPEVQISGVHDSEPWSDDNSERFAQTIEATYEGTQDCPELNGCRSGAHALVSHQMSGEFAPDLWHLYLLDDKDAGVALIAPHRAAPDDTGFAWEIVYLGVAKEFRQRGLGHRMLADLLNAARRSGAQEVMLAVDVRNEPAIQLYSQFGFREFDRRKVHARLRRR